MSESISDFRVEELFFSRTDERGVILAGNSVFARVAKYSVDQLIGAPHKIIRHPDMPRAVFWLLWHTIQQGRPIGAYVKNRAQDGSIYWVYAIVTPFQGGYLSVRLKPTSAMLEVIEREYADLRAAEREQDLEPEESAKLLLARLAELGWKDYGAFMTQALVTETTARSEALAARNVTNAERPCALERMSREGTKISSALLGKLSHVGSFPINLQIQASKLSTGGKLFNAVAENYSRLCAKITRQLETFSKSSEEVAGSVSEGLFKLLASRYQGEVIEQFRREEGQTGAGSSCADREAEIARLAAQREAFLGEVLAGLDDIASDCQVFRRHTSEMYALVTCLTATQTIGLIESARLDEAGRTLNAMISEVTEVQRDAAAKIKSLAALNDEIGELTRALSAEFRGDRRYASSGCP